VGQSTNYDKLILEIWTDGTYAPEHGLSAAAKMLIDHLRYVAGISEDTLAVPVERAWRLLNVKYVVSWRRSLEAPAERLAEVVAQDGKPVYLYRVPANYPPTESTAGNARSLSDMGVPDALGNQTTFTYDGVGNRLRVTGTDDAGVYGLEAGTCEVPDAK
jgi:hypothetical protein